MDKMTGSAMGEDTIGAIQEGIRNIAAEMLEAGEVHVFIGYEEGTLPLRTTPAFITRPEDAVRLVWVLHVKITLLSICRNLREQ